MILDQYSSYLAFLGILGYCRFFVMIHICYFYHRNVFDNKVFIMFHKFGDNIMIYALMGFPRIAVVWYRCFWWRFWRCRFSVDYLRLDTTEILILSGERLIKSSSSPCWFFLSIAFSSGTLKRLRVTKLLRSLLSDILSFAGFFARHICQFDYCRCFYFENIRYFSIFR